jgi:hypothetical protein
MAIKPLNSVAGFSVGEVPANIILGNGDITAKNATFSGNLLISNANASWGILTDKLYYSNGTPWDLQEAAGSNTQIQFNNQNNFGANANFTYDYVTSVLTLVGTANVVALKTTDIFSGPTNNLYLNANGFITSYFANGAVVFPGNVTTTGNLAVGNANLGNLVTANYINVSSNITTNNLTTNLEFQANTANFDGNVVMDNWLTVANTANVGNLRTDNILYANGTPWDLQQAAGSNTQIQYNLGNNFAASANFTYDDATQQFTVLGNGQFNNANLGNLAIANFINVASNIVTSNLSVNLELAGNTANFSGNVILPNLTVNTNLSGNVANFSGNLTSLNSNLGNLATANYVNVSQQVNGNVANFSGNLTSLNANLGNLATANYINVANDLSVLGNISAANLVGPLANGNSNVKIYSNANVEISVGGTANVATFTSTEFLVVGDIKSTTGNMLANGNVTANGFLNGANANVTGEALLGSVKTAIITAPSGNITLSAAGTNENIVLVPTGTGGVDVSLKNIIQLAAPINPNDAATKEYVDSTAQGLTIHTAVKATSTTNLNATYANGGSVLSTIAITGGKTIQFSASHLLNVGDELAWDNSFNGLVGNDPYFVFSTPAADTITVKAGYFGAEVTTLTNGTGLTQTARANTGVGATLTNAGANAAISIDGVALLSTNRVLVQGQTNQVENGIYTVTTVGNGSTAWVLTRATTEDTYSPVSTSALGYGDYFFVQQGSSYAGSSYVLTTPIGEILFGYTNIAFSQFSAAGSYSAGNGIAITGTTISANVDGVTTDIVGGNIVVKTSAQLTTPNIGAATGTSLNVTGNVDANGLSIANLANIGGNLTVAGYIFSNNAIASNANVGGTNINASGNVAAGGNVVAGNITANATLFTSNANVSGTTITNVLTVNNAITGNTANFSGNIVVNNATVNLELAGNTANFSGNVVVPNLTVNLALAGNTANFTGNVTALGVLTNNYYYANGSPVDFQQAAGSNTQLQYNNNNDFGASANLTFNSTTNVLGVIGDANVSNAVIIGNTTVTSNTVTTNSTTANQTIASIPVSGITGVEYLVKGIDSVGSKYSVATVQAVTDGTNVDYSTYGTVNLGGFTGSLAVGISGGFLRLQVTPASTNSTVWTTQYRTI